MFLNYFLCGAQTEPQKYFFFNETNNIDRESADKIKKNNSRIFFSTFRKITVSL